MKHKLIIGVLVVICLALLGAGVAWYKNNISTSKTVLEGQSQVVDSGNARSMASTSPPKQTSLNGLWRSGVSQKCTFADGDTTGTTYVANGQMRGDFSSTVNGQTITSHMLVQDNSSYVWMEGQTQGFKVSIDNLSQQVGASSSGTIDLNRQFNVECQPEKVDSSQFTVPQNIQFQDLGQSVKSKAPTSGSIDLKATQCSACDKLPGGAKEQCKKALSCTN